MLTTLLLVSLLHSVLQTNILINKYLSTFCISNYSRVGALEGSCVGTIDGTLVGVSDGALATAKVGSAVGR